MRWLLGLLLFLSGCSFMQHATDTPWFTNEGTASFVHSHCGSARVGMQGTGVNTSGGLTAGLNPSRTVSWNDPSETVVTSEVITAELNRPCELEERLRHVIEDVMQ